VLADFPAHVQLVQRVVQRLHAVLLARLHHRRDLFDLFVADERPDRGGHDQNLGGHDAAAALGLLQQRLCDDALEHERQLGTDLRLLVRREHVDDAVDAFHRRVGVQRGYSEVARLRDGQRCPVPRPGPRRFSASFATTPGSPSSSNVLTLNGICRMTSDTQPRCLKQLPRNRARFWMPKEKSSSFSVSNRFFWFSVSTEYAIESVSLGVSTASTPEFTMSPSTRSLGRSPATMWRSEASFSIISSSSDRRFTTCDAPAVMPPFPSRLPPGW